MKRVPQKFIKSWTGFLFSSPFLICLLWSRAFCICESDCVVVSSVSRVVFPALYRGSFWYTVKPYNSRQVGSPEISPYFGSFKNNVDIILLIFDHPPTSVDTFYVLNVDKMANFRPPTHPLLSTWLLNAPLYNSGFGTTRDCSNSQ